MATGPVYLSLFLLHSLSLHPVLSYIHTCMCVCTCVKDSLPCTLVLHKSDVVYHHLHRYCTSLTPTKSFFHCRYGAADEFCLPPVLSCCLAARKTICLILGDTHTPPQLRFTQIICYTSMPLFSSTSLHFSTFLFHLSHPFLFSLPLHLVFWWRLSFIKQPHL